MAKATVMDERIEAPVQGVRQGVGGVRKVGTPIVSPLTSPPLPGQWVSRVVPQTIEEKIEAAKCSGVGSEQDNGRHRWVIPMPNGSRCVGVCKWCGERREFSNQLQGAGLSETVWNARVGEHDKLVEGVLVHG